MRDELAAWLRLALTPRIGNASARKLLAAFGLPQSIFEQEPEALEQVVEPRHAEALRALPPGFEAQLEATRRWLETEGRAVVTLGEPGYPAALLNIEDPPLLLYCVGQPLATAGAAVAVVGSRNPTAQGLQNARQF